MSHRNGPNPLGWDTTGWLVFCLVFFGGCAVLTGGEARLPDRADVPESIPVVPEEAAPLT